MEKLMRPATEMTMSTLLSVSSSVTGMSDWRAKEASLALAGRLDKQNTEWLLEVCSELVVWAKSVMRKSALMSMCAYSCCNLELFCKSLRELLNCYCVECFIVPALVQPMTLNSKKNPSAFIIRNVKPRIKYKGCFKSLKLESILLSLL